MQEMQGGRRAHDHCIFIEQVKFEGCVHVLNESNAHRIKKDVRSILYTGQWILHYIHEIRQVMGPWVHGSMVPWRAHVRNGRMGGWADGRLGGWALVRDGKRW